MYLKRLIIKTPEEVLRDIEFHAGLNLIIDDTKPDMIKTTGNNVGKTTVLKLIDFCLGAKPNIIYTDTENAKDVYDTVKNFVTEQEVMVSILLVDDINDENSRTVEITRNFLNRKKAVRTINGKDIMEKDFVNELEKAIFKDKKIKKPTFRQIISHNIRYKDKSINNTLKTLDKYAKDVEYETLYLYMLGCVADDGAEKQALMAQISQEKAFKERLEKKQNKTVYEIALGLIEDEIETLNQKKANFNLNDSLEEDLEALNMVKYKINKISSSIGKMEIRKNLILEAEKEMESNAASIDMEQLRVIYQETVRNMDKIQKTFEDLVTYHNKMLQEKVKFITRDLPQLEAGIKKEKSELNILILEEKKLSEKISKGDAFEELEKVIKDINEKYRLKGEYESIIAQITESEERIEELDGQIQKIDGVLFSSEFENRLKKQLRKFNKYFSTVSQELYNESYALSYTVHVDKNGQKVYKFGSFNANMSSGKKQGEILCFDLAYLLFAKEENIPSLQFLLNDKKELMHDNQLIKVSDFLQKKNMQLVVSILKDKLPQKVLESANVVVELSQDSKLFRIEEKNFGA